jgi:ribosomal protein S21
MAIEILVRHQSASGIDQALRLLRRQVSREGLFLTLRDKVAYVKPGDKLRRKRGRAESRRWKARERARSKAAQRS